MTGRGAVVAMLSLFFAATLTASWLHLASLTGAAFVGGCALAAGYTRRDGLLAVVAAPPMLFMVALVTAEVLTSHGSTVRHTLISAAEGTVLTLAAVAPWLFAGVVLGLIIAIVRGLPQCIRDLGADLRGRADVADPAAPQRTHPGSHDQGERAR